MEHTPARPPQSRRAHLQRCRSLCAQILRTFRTSFLCASAAHFIGMKPPGGHDIRFDAARQEINRGRDQSHGIRHGRRHDRHAFKGGLALPELTSRATTPARSQKVCEPLGSYGSQHAAVAMHRRPMSE